MTDIREAAEVKKAMDKLDMIEQAVAKSAGRFDDLRSKADEVYESRVEMLAELHGVDISKAHGLAASDEIASRAYAVSNELAERQQAAHEGGSHMAAYIE